MKPNQKNKFDVDAALDREEAAIAKAQGLIEWAMEMEGISQRELAERLGVSQAAVSQLLGLSPRNMSVKRLARVMYALGDRLVISSEKREAFLTKRHNRVARSSAVYRQIDPINDNFTSVTTSANHTLDKPNLAWGAQLYSEAA